MSLHSTKQLSEKATKEVLQELVSPKSTPQSKAQHEKVKTMAAKAQIDLDGKKSTAV